MLRPSWTRLDKRGSEQRKTTESMDMVSVVEFWLLWNLYVLLLTAFAAALDAVLLVKCKESAYCHATL